jgi:uncharacterized membrane protein YkvA (DUF1232 family)
MNLGIMTAKYTDFKEAMTTELIDFVRSQASALSVADLDRLIIDLPALRERFAKIPSQTYAYLSVKLEFLCLFVEEQVVGRNRDLAEEPVAEAAFALLYFQRAADLIPDSIPGMGLLDDATIASMVLRRQEHAAADAVGDGAYHGRGHGRSLRRRLGPGDLRHYARSVHRLHLQRLRDPWFTLVVFPIRRRRSQVCLSEACPSDHPLFYRRQDAPG